MSEHVLEKGHGSVVEAWQPPSVSAAAGKLVHSALRKEQEEDLPQGPLTAEQIEAIQQQAYDEGYALGQREGRESGLSEARQHVQKIEAILNRLARPLEEMDEAVMHQVVDLAVTVAKHLIRRELRTDPGQVVAVVREAIAALPVSASKIRIHLHPEDASLVRDALSVAEDEQHWRIVDDPVITRGGCNVLTEYSQVDATVEKRLAAIITQLLGGEREADMRLDEGNSALEEGAE